MCCRLVGEEALEEIGVGLGLQRYVKHALVPALHRPPHALAKIVYGTPIGQANHTVEVHLEIVWSHGGSACLALIEYLVGIAARVAGEVHVAVVVRCDVGGQGKRCRNGVGVEAAVAGMHGHGYEARVVVSAQQFALQPVGRHAPVVERQVGILLKLVAKAPQHYRRMVAVALDKLRHVLLPKALPLHSSAGILREPLVVQLIHHEQSQSVAKAQEVLAVWIVRRAHMIIPKFLHQLQPLLYGSRKGSGSQCAQRMVVGPTLQQHLLAVEQQATLWSELHGAHAKLLADAVGHAPLVVVERHLGRVEIRRFARPQLGVGQSDGGQLVLACAPFCIEVDVVPFACHHIAFSVENPHFCPNLVGLVVAGNLGLNLHLVVVFGAYEQRMAGEIEALVGNDEVDVAVESATRVPSRVVGLLSVGLYNNLVLLPIFQFVGNVDVKSEVAVVGTAYSLSVEPHVAHEHNALEVDYHPASSPFVVGHQRESIPTHVHLLESTRAQSASYVAARVAVVGTLRSVGFHPRLSDEEVVWQIDRHACGILHFRHVRQFAEVELPSTVETYRISLCGRRFTCEHCHSRQNHYFLHCHVFNFLFLISFPPAWSHPHSVPHTT